MNKLVISNGEPSVSSSRRVVVGDIGKDNDKPLYTQSDINFQVSNNMKDPLEMIRGVIKTIKKGKLALALRGTGAAGDLISSQATRKNTRFMSPYNNTKVWVSTNPLKFSIDLDFSLGMWGLWDAQQEVIDPIKQLSKYVVPRVDASYLVTGPGPSMVAMLTHVVSGAGLKDAIQHPIQATKGIIDNKDGNFLTKFSSSVTGFFESQTETITKISILNGGLLIDAYIDNCTWSYGDITDDKGNPTTGKIRLSCSTYKMANTDYVFRGFGSDGRLNPDTESNDYGIEKATQVAMNYVKRGE